MIIELDLKAGEYMRKTGERSGDDLLARVLWEAMDEKSMDEAEQKGIDTTDASHD